MARITIFRELCKGVGDCGICAFVCPQELFRASETMNEAGFIPAENIDPTRCNGCLNCMVYCPDFAIVVEKDESEADLEKGK